MATLWLTAPHSRSRESTAGTLSTPFDRRPGPLAFVLVGGVAARLRGAPLLTQDVDITPEPTAVNMGRLGQALEETEARLRSASETEGNELPYDADLIATKQLWTLTTEY